MKDARRNAITYAGKAHEIAMGEIAPYGNDADNLAFAQVHATLALAYATMALDEGQ